MLSQGLHKRLGLTWVYAPLSLPDMDPCGHAKNIHIIYKKVLRKTTGSEPRQQREHNKKNNFK